MSNYKRKGRYIVPANEPQRDPIPGKSGNPVLRVGCNLNAAMYPVEPQKFDPTEGLIAELEAQRHRRRSES